MTSAENALTKQTVFPALKELAKQYRKLCGNSPAEIIIVGGGSILLNYGFRDSTMDLDVVLHAASGMNDAVLRVADKMNLPRDWMNTDFQFTTSYSEKIAEVSQHYASLNNGQIEIRTIDAEYLIAMKLQSGRPFGPDLSDAIGILAEEKEKGRSITASDIRHAGAVLYGSQFHVSAEIGEIMEPCFGMPVDQLREKYIEMTQLAKDIKADITSRTDSENINRTTAKDLALKILGYKQASQKSDNE